MENVLLGIEENAAKELKSHSERRLVSLRVKKYYFCWSQENNLASFFSSKRIKISIIVNILGKKICKNLCKKLGKKNQKLVNDRDSGQR